MTVSEAFGDVADILARLNPAQVLKLHAPSAMAERVEKLVNTAEYLKNSFFSLFRLTILQA